jgi:hypothetical protein
MDLAMHVKGKYGPSDNGIADPVERQWVLSQGFPALSDQ